MKYLTWVLIFIIVTALVAISLNTDNINFGDIIEWLRHQLATRPIQAAGLFFALYFLSTAVSIPGAALLTLAAGALFGLFWGTLIVSFASTLGACAAFTAARVLFRDSIQTRFHKPLNTMNEGIKNEGAYYLFTLRLVPLFPFFLINLLMGLSPIKLRTFYWVSQLGMLPATILYVNAGALAGDINQVNDLLSLPLLASFILLGIFPLLAKRCIHWFKTRKQLTS